MAWAKIDDKFPEHEKVVGLSNAAFRLHVSAICYASRNETDGRISQAAAKALHGVASRTGELVEAGLWERNGVGWKIHDFLQYNPSHEQLEKKRAEARERIAKARRAPRHVDEMFAGSS